MSFHIRRLEPKDKERWLILFKGYIEFYKASVPDDVIELTWQRLMAGTPDFHIGLVALDAQGVLVGIAHVLFHRSTWSPTTYCYLEDLFVDPAIRGQGAGRQLIEAVYAEADARKCTRTYWSTQEFNYRARGLYDKMAAKSVFVQYRR
jgi:GNAT superfamily N-acetyltransferase